MDRTLRVFSVYKETNNQHWTRTYMNSGGQVAGGRDVSMAQPEDRRVLPHINRGAHRALTVNEVGEREAEHSPRVNLNLLV